MLALTNQLMVSKIDKQGEEPVFEIEQPQQQEGDSKPKKVAYYEFKVRFEISGNYANYTSFRKGLAQLKKIINIDQEKIIVLQSETKKGEVRVTAVLAIYRLPANESEKYVNSEEVLQ
jgi:Tfp pilus assembly protein PilO